jgi:hypothetical protein
MHLIQKELCCNTLHEFQEFLVAGNKVIITENSLFQRFFLFPTVFGCRENFTKNKPYFQCRR